MTMKKNPKNKEYPPITLRGLNYILDIMDESPVPLSINEIADIAGMSWVTTKKYMEILEKDFDLVCAYKSSRNRKKWVLKERVKRYKPLEYKNI